jgi:hypothetical protein
VTRLRWILVLLLWAALDLTGPLLPVPVEALEEPEAAAHRAAPRHRSRQPERRAEPAVDQNVRSAAARLASRVAVAAPRWTRDAGVVLKLPPSGAPPESAPDDH